MNRSFKKYKIQMFDIKSNKHVILQTPPVLKYDSEIYFKEIFESIEFDNKNNEEFGIDINTDDNWATIYRIRYYGIKNEKVKDVLFLLSLMELNNVSYEYKTKDHKNNYRNDYINDDLILSFREELNYRLSLPKFALKQI